MKESELVEKAAGRKPPAVKHPRLSPPEKFLQTSNTAHLVQRALRKPQQTRSAGVLALQRAVGNRQTNQLLRAQQDGKLVQRAGGEENGFKRWMRIFKRQLMRKSLPEHLYRLDARVPEKIMFEGFQPWKDSGTISIKEHVSGVLEKASPSGGTLAKQESQYVSTAAYKGLADPILAQICGGKYLYKVDSGYAGMNKSSFTDVNDYFDRLGKKRPFPKQREWIKDGGIPASAVTHFMPAENLYKNQVTFLSNPLRLKMPAEEKITGWQPMPTGQDYWSRISGDMYKSGEWS
jgi:hypothetical protein